jgi:hypothetical protein
MHKTTSSHTRAWLSAVAVPVVSIALAATAWFGGHLPADQLAADAGSHHATLAKKHILPATPGGAR